MPIIKKKILIFGPLEIFENENFDASAPKIWIWTSRLKSYLNFSYLTCTDRSKKNFHAPPYCLLVPRTADRGSGVGQMSPNLKTKVGGGDAFDSILTHCSLVVTFGIN